MRRHHAFFPSRTLTLKTQPGYGRVMIIARPDPAETGMNAFAAFPDAGRTA